MEAVRLLQWASKVNNLASRNIHKICLISNNDCWELLFEEIWSCLPMQQNMASIVIQTYRLCVYYRLWCSQPLWRRFVQTCMQAAEHNDKIDMDTLDSNLRKLNSQ